MRAKEKRAAITIALYRGPKAFLIPENEEKIKKVFRLAQKLALRDVGVLNEEFEVIPGQERFAEQWGIKTTGV